MTIKESALKVKEKTLSKGEVTSERQNDPSERGNRIMTSKFRFLRGRLSVFLCPSEIVTKGDL